MSTPPSDHPEYPERPEYPQRPQYGERDPNLAHDAAPSGSSTNPHHPHHAASSADSGQFAQRPQPQPTARGRLIPPAREIPVTWTLIGLCTVIYLLQWMVPNSLVTARMAYFPALTELEPWRMLTSGFVHSPGNPMHLLLNMYTLLLFGQALEPQMGRWRFLTVYLVSILGGSAAVWLLADPLVPVVGASGGIFGLFGALFVGMRRTGAPTGGLVALVVINLIFGFVMPGIAWEAHLGGLAAGALAAFLLHLVAPRGPRPRPTRQNL